MKELYSNDRSFLCQVLKLDEVTKKFQTVNYGQWQKLTHTLEIVIFKKYEIFNRDAKNDDNNIHFIYKIRVIYNETTLDLSS